MHSLVAVVDLNQMSFLLRLAVHCPSDKYFANNHHEGFGRNGYRTAVYPQMLLAALLPGFFICRDGGSRTHKPNYRRYVSRSAHLFSLKQRPSPVPRIAFHLPRPYVPRPPFNNQFSQRPMRFGGRGFLCPAASSFTGHRTIHEFFRSSVMQR